MPKIPLLIKEDKVKTGSRRRHLKACLPFFQARIGNYVHRIRSAGSYYYHGEYSHTCFDLWCGGTGHTRKWSRLLEFVPEGEMVCATCEGRAIGAGQTDSRTINGRPVIFQPRNGKWLLMQPIPEMPIQTS